MNYNPKDRKTKSFRLQKKSLETFKNYENKRAQFIVFTSKMLNKEPKMSVMKQSENYRKVHESKSLIELGDSIRDKYGDEKAWKVTLR